VKYLENVLQENYLLACSEHWKRNFSRFAAGNAMLPFRLRDLLD
jgi:hypothetical protein